MINIGCLISASASDRTENDMQMHNRTVLSQIMSYLHHSHMAYCQERMPNCQERLFVPVIILAITPLRGVSPRRIDRILPIEVGNTHPYRLRLAPPLVYCPFPLAALNKEPEIDWFFGAVEPVGAEPDSSGARVFTPQSGLNPQQQRGK
jgi:hypothetical protein